MTLSKPATSEPKEVLVEYRVWPSAQSIGDRKPPCSFRSRRWRGY